MARTVFYIFSLLIIAAHIGISFFWPPVWWGMLLFGPIILLGVYDVLQTKQTIRRNFPVIGNFRYLFEEIRPEINQYFVESNTDGAPYSRERRSLIYQRSKNCLDTLPFGTQMEVYAEGYEWVNHSIRPTHIDPKDLRVVIGGPQCKQPYNASILNISAMSYGSMSKNAIMALNQGAQKGHFAHNTGEGGISPYHLQGGDLIWQIGTGYFGCRTMEGTFDPVAFTATARQAAVKMIEIKISQGAKPGHGGILPASKVTAEIATIRKVPIGKQVLSPPGHSMFTTPVKLLEFLQSLREMSDGKPVGFKLCVGKRREFLAICKAMVETGITPDFIAVDGAEGGTGAAPLEFSNHIGCPLSEGLIFVHNALVGVNLREDITVISSGKVASGFDMIKRIALGADICYAARSFMISLGCIQALRCNHNNCPTGVATQDPRLIKGLVVKEKNKRVASYHEATLESVAEILGAMGLHSTADLRPWHIMRRVDHVNVMHYGEINEYLKAGQLLNDNPPKHYKRAWHAASAHSFEYNGPDISTRKYHAVKGKSL